MMNAIKSLERVQPFGQAISTKLPQQVVEVDPSRPALPYLRPPRQIIVVEHQKGPLGFLEGTFNHSAVVAASNDVNYISSADESLGPIPTDPRFRTLVWLTRICREEKLHVCSILFMPGQSEPDI